MLTACLVKKCTHTFHQTAQIEQEMALVVDTSDVKTEFFKMWSTVYVPAILSYGRNTRSVLNILSTMDETGKSSEHVLM